MTRRSSCPPKRWRSGRRAPQPASAGVASKVMEGMVGWQWVRSDQVQYRGPAGSVADVVGKLGRIRPGAAGERPCPASHPDRDRRSRPVVLALTCAPAPTDNRRHDRAGKRRHTEIPMHAQRHQPLHPVRGHPAQPTSARSSLQPGDQPGPYSRARARARGFEGPARPACVCSPDRWSAVEPLVLVALRTHEHDGHWFRGRLSPVLPKVRPNLRLSGFAGSDPPGNRGYECPQGNVGPSQSVCPSLCAAGQRKSPMGTVRRVRDAAPRQCGPLGKCDADRVGNT
jgi:hypothetical protein